MSNGTCKVIRNLSRFNLIWKVQNKVVLRFIWECWLGINYFDFITQASDFFYKTKQLKKKVETPWSHLNSRYLNPIPTRVGRFCPTYYAQSHLNFPLHKCNPCIIYVQFPNNLLSHFGLMDENKINLTFKVKRAQSFNL